MSALQTLLDMGFSENSSKKALAVTGGGVEQAMEWLLAHADDPGIHDPPGEEQPKLVLPSQAKAAQGETVGASGQQEKMETSEASETEKSSKEGEAGETSGEKMETSEASGAEKTTSAEEEAAKSIKCDDCGKLFQTSEEVEFHAVKSGHSNFSESTEEKKPLSEEEKLAKKLALQQKIKQRRKERVEQEEKEAREREKKRIQQGQQIAERKRTMQEEEMKKIAAERRREKLEDKIARQKVRDQIEADRQARKEMYAQKEGGASAAPAPAPAPAPVAAPAQKKEYTTTRLQIRLPAGMPLVQEFKAKESLSAVRLWIGLNRQDGVPADDPFNLSMPFPRKNFTDEDMDKPLDLLGLVPSAVLMVSK